MDGAVIQRRKEFLPAFGGFDVAIGLRKWNSHFGEKTRAIRDGLGLLINEPDAVQTSAMQITSPHPIPDRVMLRFLRNDFFINVDKFIAYNHANDVAVVGGFPANRHFGGCDADKVAIVKIREVGKKWAGRHASQGKTANFEEITP